MLDIARVFPNERAMQPSYDPDRDEITLPPNASAYQLAHERAHQWQRRHRGRLWRMHEVAGAWPYVARPLRLLVEWQAMRWARVVLLPLGRWDRHAREEARAGLWSYVRACFWP